MSSPFPCSLVIRECSWKKTQIEKSIMWRTALEYGNIHICSSSSNSIKRTNGYTISIKHGNELFLSCWYISFFCYVKSYLNKAVTTFCDKLCWIFFLFARKWGKFHSKFKKGFLDASKHFLMDSINKDQ